MASKYTIEFQLGNASTEPPANWMDIRFNAAFGAEMQPELDNTSFRFVGKNAQVIYDHLQIYGPLVGIKFEIVVSSLGQAYYYNCVLDLTDMSCTEIKDAFGRVIDREYEVAIKPDEGLDLLDAKLKSISLGYLAQLEKGDKGKIDQSHYTDVPVIIRKKFDATEVAMASLAILVVENILVQNKFEKLKNDYQAIKAILSDPLQKPAEIFFRIVTLILILAYYAALLIAVIRAVKTIFDNLAPKPTKYKGIKLRTALERILERFDTTLECDIPELDIITYVPSKRDDKIRQNRKDEGIPNVDDFGYQASEMLDIVFNLFRAKPIMRPGKVLKIEPEKDNESDSGYVMPDVLLEQFRFNTEDLKANFLLTFSYDPTDEYTLPNARNTPFDSKKRDAEKRRYDEATSFEVITDIISAETKLLKGLEEIRIPLALGTRRDTLSVLDEVLRFFANIVDKVVNLFGGKLDLTGQIDSHRGKLLISSNSFSIPKLVVIQNGVIPQNHRDILSAEALYRNYHYWRSFKNNPQNTQGRIYENIRIPFEFANFIKTNQSPYFTTFEGKRGKFTQLKWSVAKDEAIADFIVYGDPYIPSDRLTEREIKS